MAKSANKAMDKYLYYCMLFVYIPERTTPSGVEIGKKMTGQAHF